MKDIRECEVCGKIDQVYVASSALGPISFARCLDCVSKGLEPYWLIVANAAMCNYPDGCGKEFLEYIDYYLEELKISKNKFEKDVEIDTKKLDDYMK